MNKICYICVDIEAAGPNPYDYAMLSLGASTVEHPLQSFYVELKPTTMAELEEATAVHGLSLARLEKEGQEPKAALEELEKWINQVRGDRDEIVFVAFNAPFDWMFVNDYFMRYLGRNPFGHRALDMKALYMGMRGVPWLATSHRAISEDYAMMESLSHHAEEDALQEAELFRRMLQELEAKHPDLLEENLK